MKLYALKIPLLAASFSTSNYLAFLNISLMYCIAHNKMHTRKYYSTGMCLHLHKAIQHQSLYRYCKSREIVIYLYNDN